MCRKINEKEQDKKNNPEIKTKKKQKLRPDVLLIFV